MNTCEEFRKHIVDYHEGTLPSLKHNQFEEHMRRCGQCQGEYSAFKRLCEVLDSDEVVLPARGFFDGVRRNVRQRRLQQYRFGVPKLIRILIPVFAVAAVLFIATRHEKTTDMTIAAETFLDDQDIASLSLPTIVDDKLVGELSLIEADFYSSVDELIEGLTDEERTAFLDALYEKYGNGT